MFILERAAFFLEGIQTTQFHHKKNEKTQQDRYFDETNEKSGNYCK